MGRSETHVLARCYQSVFQPQDSLASPQSGLQFCRIAWLYQIIVGTGIESGHQVFSRVLGCQQNQINISMPMHRAQLMANLWPIQLRHHPVQQCQSRTIVIQQLFYRVAAVFRRRYFVANLPEHPFHDRARNRIIVCNEDLHGTVS